MMPPCDEVVGTVVENEYSHPRDGIEQDEVFALLWVW